MPDVEWVPVRQVVDDLGLGATSWFAHHGGPTACWQPHCTPLGLAAEGCTPPEDAPSCGVNRLAHLAGPRVVLKPDGTREWQVNKAQVWRIAAAEGVPLPEQYPAGSEPEPQPIPVPPPPPGSLPSVPGPSTPLGAPLAYAPGESPRQRANVATALQPRYR